MNTKYLTRKVTIDRAGLSRLFARITSQGAADAAEAGGKKAMYAMMDTLVHSMTATEMANVLFGDEVKARTISGGRYALAALIAIRSVSEPPEFFPDDDARSASESMAYAAMRLLTDAADELFGADKDEVDDDE